MKTFCLSHIFPPISFVVVSLLAGVALAQEAVGSETLADSLLPLETRSVNIQADPGLFKSVANDINASYQITSESSDATELLGAGFLEGLVDENGEVNLPMGITVFDAMGATSVGFGGSF